MNTSLASSPEIEPQAEAPLDPFGSERGTSLKRTLDDPAGLAASEHSFPSFDGTPLFYRAWIPAGGFDRIVILLHRGHEHSARWADFAAALKLPRTAIFAWDERGHGVSPGERGWAQDFSVYARDLDEFVRHLSAAHHVPVRQFALVAHSVAAVIAAAWVHDYAPPIRALVLATPAFQVKLYIPFAIPGLRLLQAFRPKSFIKSYVGGRLLTRDAEEARKYDSDPAISRNIAVNILLGLFDTSRRLVADAGAIVTPTLLLSAGADLVVKNQPHRAFFARLSSAVKEHVVLPGFRHAIFHEQGRGEVAQRVSSFLRERFEADAAPASLLEADQTGYTRAEFDELRKPLPRLSPRRWLFALQALGLRTLGRLSHGVATGWRTGFDSGESLDAVYEQQPRGVTPLGRLIDRGYLDSVGWKGIRQRKVHLRRALENVLHTVHREGQPLRVVDIASGPGRYLLESLKALSPLPVEALCRDRSASGIAAGRELARQLGVERVTYEQGDAFDTAELAALAPKPTVAVVSGLYELFPENAPIRSSLAGLHAALPDGGWLLYTNQPWHPQVEMIARVLPNRDGQPWIMRRRTQAEMDELVRAAGFEKVGMEIDRWGIFTVSIARKLPVT